MSTELKMLKKALACLDYVNKNYDSIEGDSLMNANTALKVEDAHYLVWEAVVKLTKQSRVDE